MNTLTARQHLRSETESAWRSAQLASDLAKTSVQHWHHGDVVALKVASDLFATSANVLADAQVLPEYEAWTRGLARADAARAKLLRHMFNTYSSTPPAFVAALAPARAQAFTACDRAIEIELARLQLASSPCASHLAKSEPTPAHTSPMRGLRYLPWFALAFAAMLAGAVGPREQWLLPAVAVVSFAAIALFVRLGLHRIR